MPISGTDKDPFRALSSIVQFTRRYIPWPIKRQPITISDDRTGKMLRIQIGNVKWSKLLGRLRTADVRNSVVVLRKTYYDISREMENSVVLFKGRIAEVLFNEENVDLTASDLTWNWGRRSPDKLFSISCMHMFNGRDCGYLGPDALCNKSFEDCTTKRNTGRFGGFTQVSQGQVRDFVE